MKKPEGYVDRFFDERYQQNVKEFYNKLNGQLFSLKDFFTQEKLKIENLL